MHWAALPHSQDQEGKNKKRKGLLLLSSHQHQPARSYCSSEVEAERRIMDQNLFGWEEISVPESPPIKFYINFRKYFFFLFSFKAIWLAARVIKSPLAGGDFGWSRIIYLPFIFLLHDIYIYIYPLKCYLYFYHKMSAFFRAGCPFHPIHFSEFGWFVLVLNII